MPKRQAHAALGGGTGVAEISAWIRAGLIDVHRHNDEFKIPRASVDRMVAMLANFPSDDGRPGLAPFAELDRGGSRHYSLEDFLVDIVSGHIETFVRDRSRAGLHSLVFDVRDLARRQSAMFLAALAASDAARNYTYVARHFVAVWGERARLSASELAAVAATGRIRKAPMPGTNAHYSMRDVLNVLQAKPDFERAIRLQGRYVPDHDNLRDLVVLSPKGRGLLEIAGFSAKWTRF